MRYQHVCLESFGYTLPQEIVSSEEIEHRLEPLYSRLRLPAGRLELMTGIRERRFWPRGTLPSQMSVVSGRRAMEAAAVDPNEIGALVHGSVCRDFLEPATACAVHRQLGLSRRSLNYDVSNACLGLLNGVLQVANLIELREIRAGLVVASEGSRELVETTIAALNADESLTRETVKPAMASLTIGSASAAVLLVHRDLSKTGNRLLGATARTNTAAVHLCHSGRDESVELVGGFNTEYTGIRFAIFFLAEFMNVITMSAIAVTLFLGGPSGPSLGFLSASGVVNVWLMPMFWFLAKVLVLLFATVWVRASLPRMRYDRLMSLGWKWLIEIAILWVLITATVQVASVEHWDRLVAALVAVIVAVLAYGVLYASMPKSGEKVEEFR